MFAGFCAFLQLYATQPILPLFERLFAASKIAVTICAWVPSTADVFQNLNEVDRKASAVLHFSEKEFR